MRNYLEAAGLPAWSKLQTLEAVAGAMADAHQLVADESAKRAQAAAGRREAEARIILEIGNGEGEKRPKITPAKKIQACVALNPEYQKASDAEAMQAIKVARLNGYLEVLRLIAGGLDR